MATMLNLLECGVHFGHQTRRWNPKMKKFIFSVRKNIYIIDLQKTVRYFNYACNVVEQAAFEGKSIVFVGTKKQASVPIKKAAEACGMPYVNHRWLGGMFTNYPTIKKSIKKLDRIKQMREKGQFGLLTKKEALMLQRKEARLESYFAGVKNMTKLPEFMFVIDTIKEHTAILEARRLGIKIVAPIDTNCDPDLIDYPIPGNDDAIRAIALFCDEISEAVNKGKARRAEEAGSQMESLDDAQEEKQEEIASSNEQELQNNDEVSENE